MPIIRDILFGAANKGASLVDLCTTLNISLEELNDSENYLDFDRAYKTWEEATRATRDKFLGLHLGESTHPSILGLIGHLMLSSPNLEEAFKRVCQHGKLATDMFVYDWKKSKENFILTFQPADLWLKISEKSARQAVEQAMAGTLNVFRLLAGKSIFPVSVTFQFAKPKELYEYERIFKSEIQFSADLNQLIFSVHDLATPVVSYDKSLYALFDQLLEARSASLAGKSNFADQVSDYLLKKFRTQIPSVEVISSSMNMTPRTFQRKLREAGESYRGLSARLRKEMALKLIRNSEHKMEEIAEMLGYSEASSFRRAFKGWTDTQPSQLKRKSSSTN